MVKEKNLLHYSATKTTRQVSSLVTLFRNSLNIHDTSLENVDIKMPTRSQRKLLKHLRKPGSLKVKILTASSLVSKCLLSRPFSANPAHFSRIFREISAADRTKGRKFALMIQKISLSFSKWPLGY